MAPSHFEHLQVANRLNVTSHAAHLYVGASYSCLQIKAAYQNQQCCDNPNGVFAFPTSNTNGYLPFPLLPPCDLPYPPPSFPLPGDNRRQLQVGLAKKFKILRDLLKQGILRQEEFDTQMMRLLNNLM